MQNTDREVYPGKAGEAETEEVWDLKESRQVQSESRKTLGHWARDPGWSQFPECTEG